MSTATLRLAVHAQLHSLCALRSTWLTLTIATAIGILVGVLNLHSTAQGWVDLPAPDRVAFDPVADAFTGLQFTQLGFGALGVSWAAGDYGRNSIDSSLLAMPRRLELYVAKAAVLTGMSGCFAAAGVVGSFAWGSLELRGAGLAVGWSAPGVVRSVAAAALIITAVTLIGYGLGALLRHTATAVSLLVGLVFLAWPIARAIEEWSQVPNRWLLVNASDALVGTHPITGPNALRAPSPGMAVVEILTYLALSLGLGAWRFTRDP